MHMQKSPICVIYEEQELILVIPVVPETTLWVIKFSTVENLIKTKTFKISSNDMESKMTFQTTNGNYTLYEKGIGNFKAKLGIPQNSIIVYSTIQNKIASVVVRYI